MTLFGAFVAASKEHKEGGASISSSNARGMSEGTMKERKQASTNVSTNIVRGMIDAHSKSKGTRPPSAQAVPSATLIQAGRPSSLGSSEEIRKAFEAVLRLYYRQASSQEISAMLALVAPSISDLVRGRWADSAKARHGSSILECFRKADADGSGCIDADEFIKAVAEAKLDETQARQIFAAADKDHSGTLDMEEFIELVAACPALVDAFPDILKAASERRQRLEEKRLSTFLRNPLTISPTSGVRRRPALIDVKPSDEVVIVATPQGRHVHVM